jgi:glutaredoxin
MQKRLIAIVLSFAAILLVSCAPPGPGEYDELAKCMTESGAKMYGTEWCGHCKNQKELFGNSFENIDYIDCDKQRGLCTAAGIEGYPTWVINGEKHSGTQNLYELAKLTSCEL